MVSEFQHWLIGKRPPQLGPRVEVPSARPYRRFRRVVLTDGVGRALFEEYALHQKSARGDEETGWLLLGVRQEAEALVLATLPAGVEYDAGASHVRFNSQGQAIGSRIVRQADKRLTVLGVVHTHPGSLRHPSDGDFRADSEWVGQLRGQEGIFAIGTMDAGAEETGSSASQPKPNVQCWAGLRISWYTLRHGEDCYRAVPIHLTLGPDLARPLHKVWSVIEKHAAALDRLYRQQAAVRFELVSRETGPALAVSLPLWGNASEVKITLHEKQEQYHVIQNGKTFEAKLEDSQVDRAVYLLLAELAGQSA
jgi:proteasome lid subunit RPN8/RPN11